MKTIFRLPKTINLLLVIFLLSMGISCKGQKEDDKNFAGSSKRTDICQLITKDDIRSVFELSDEIEINQKKSKNAICSYGWRTPGEKFIFYSLKLNFARGGKRTNNQIDAIWESQNKKLYNRHNLQKVSGVGDRASWSDLGGGQLRVAANGSIFYVSFSVTPKKESPMDTKAMIGNASTIAKHVIKKM